MFGFKKKDPMCGMKQNEGGIKKYDQWFCSNTCLIKYEKAIKKMESKRSCCS